MQYKRIEDNLPCLLQTAGPLLKEQIVRFFSDEASEKRVETILKRMVYSGAVVYLSDTGRYQMKSYVEEDREIIKKKLRAFWVIANAGSRNVLYISQADFPSQYQFISGKNDVYDITICNCAAEAQLFREHLSYRIPRGQRDYINHVAVVKDEPTGIPLGNYGFDCFCLINQETGNVRYEYCDNI